MEKHRDQQGQGVVIVADCDHPSIDIERSVLADVAPEVRWLACKTEDEIIAAYGLHLSGQIEFADPAQAVEQFCAGVDMHGAVPIRAEA